MVDQSQEVAALSARVAALEASNKAQADEIKELKATNASLAASKREKEKRQIKEELGFDDANTEPFDSEQRNKKADAFGFLDAALRRGCAPSQGKMGSKQSASVAKRAELMGMLFEKYATSLDLDEGRAYLPKSWATRIETLEYIVSRLRDALAMLSSRHSNAKAGSLATEDRENMHVIMTALAAEPAEALELSGMSNKITATDMLNIKSIGGNSPYKAAVKRRSEADAEWVRYKSLEGSPPPLVAGDSIVCNAGKGTVTVLESTGRITIKLDLSGENVTYERQGTQRQLRVPRPLSPS